MNDKDFLNQTLREAGPRYIVDTQQRVVGYLLTPEEYAAYREMLADRANSQTPEMAPPRPGADLTPQGIPGEQWLVFAGTISLDELRLMQQAIEFACETIDIHDW